MQFSIKKPVVALALMTSFYANVPLLAHAESENDASVVVGAVPTLYQCYGQGQTLTVLNLGEPKVDVVVTEYQDGNSAETLKWSFHGQQTEFADPTGSLFTRETFSLQEEGGLDATLQVVSVPVFGRGGGGRGGFGRGGRGGWDNPIAKKVSASLTYLKQKISYECF